MPTPEFYKTTYLQLTQSKITDDESLEKVLQWADHNYAVDDTDTRFRVAYSYLAGAEYLEKATDIQLKLKRACRLFHFAGHHLRLVENWNNAGLAYLRAGSLAIEVEDFEWAVRSFARAKQCFADVGDAEEAAQAYVKEQDARRFRAHKNKDAIQFVTLTLWQWTSLYGQSWRRWLACMVGLLLVFAGVYEWQFRIGLLELPEGSHWTMFITGLYHAAATVLTLGFDEIRPISAVSQLAVLLNLALAWALLGIGAGMIARRVKER